LREGCLDFAAAVSKFIMKTSYSQKTIAACFRALLLLALICVSGGIYAGGGTPSVSEFIGAWKLRSFIFQRADGTVQYPFGEDPQGIVVYDAKGYMSAQIMRRNIPKFASGERDRETSAEEIRAAYNGFVAYGGTYETDPVSKTVTFHINVTSFPNWVDTDLKRTFELTGSRLTLRSKIPSIEGVPATGVQVWERLD
jgi:lipocalin-like protein